MRLLCSLLTSSRRSSPLPWLLALSLLVAACAGPPTRPLSPEALLEQQAAELAASGRSQEIPALYRAAAARTQGEQRLHYRLLAAYWSLRLGRPETALQDVQGLPLERPPPADALLAAIVSARLALWDHRPDLALARMGEAPTPDPDSPYVQDYHGVRADAYAMAGNRLESARERVWLDGLLAEAADRAANQQAIWDALSGLSNTALERLRTAPPPDVLSGWMELVQIARRARLDPTEMNPALAAWRLRYPNHPAEAHLLPDLARRGTLMPPAVDRIALLLPLSGPLAQPAAAVRDGVLAAHFTATGEDLPGEIRIYDTGAGPHVVWQLYQQAIVDGAQLVIGPLHKEAVANLARAGLLEVPVLALNQVDIESPPANLYQFGLAPEDEARQAANRARWDGHEGAIALVPEGDWGDRVLAAFSRQWRSLGGELLAIERYGARQSDFAGPIRSALNLEASRSRQVALVRLLGRPIEFEPRRRQDVDMVLLLGQPEQARQLRPQLRFHHASDLPVYSTSHVYAGVEDRTRDQDMNGLRFCDIPWILAPEELQPAARRQVAAIWPEQDARYGRLYALGADAYGLLPHLQGLGSLGFDYFDGFTGNLSLDAEGRLHRELVWAEFRAGRPALLEPALLSPQPGGPGPQDWPMEGDHEDEGGFTDEPTTPGPAGRASSPALPGEAGAAPADP